MATRTGSLLLWLGLAVILGACGSEGGVTSGSSASGGSTAVGGSEAGPIGGGDSQTGTCQPATCGTHKWACWPMPNPPGTGPHAAMFSVSDGIVHDGVTCLDWQASGPDGEFTQVEAGAYCEDLVLDGYDDWRLPTRIEMTSILDFTRSPASPEVLSARGGFHRTGSNWILTADGRANGDLAWAFNFSDGIASNAYSAASAAAVRCVRGNGPGETFSEPAIPPPDQYTILSETQARDNFTLLVWQRDGTSSGPLSWEDAIAYCGDLRLEANDDWRLPTVRELATLVDEARVAPAINREVFPDTVYGARSNNWYWASHRARNSDAAWALNFDDGFTGFNSGAAEWNTFGPSYARCVRND